MTENGLAEQKSAESSPDYLKELIRTLLDEQTSWSDRQASAELIEASIVGNTTNKTALFNTGECDLHVLLMDLYGS